MSPVKAREGISTYRRYARARDVDIQRCLHVPSQLTTSGECCAPCARWMGHKRRNSVPFRRHWGW